jgi:hypothetical protein
MPGTDAAIRRFVRLLIRTGSAVRTSDGDYLAATEEARAGLSETEIRKLAAQGLVRLRGGTCLPTSESDAWLRRRLAGQDGFASQHRVLASGPEGSLRDLSADVLTRLARATGSGFLQPHHLAAGRRVCQWGMRAQLRQRVTMSYDPAQIGGRRRNAAGADIADMAIEARQSLARLFRDLPRDCAEIIIDVCVFEKGLQTIESERGWPRRSAKLVLRIGLERLAERLGLAPAAVGHASGRINAWLDEGFQPTRFE